MLLEASPDRFKAEVNLVYLLEMYLVTASFLLLAVKISLPESCAESCQQTQ